MRESGHGLAYLPTSADTAGKSSLQQANTDCELRMSRATRRVLRSRAFTSREPLILSSSTPAWYVFGASGRGNIMIAMTISSSSLTYRPFTNSRKSRVPRGVSFQPAAWRISAALFSNSGPEPKSNGRRGIRNGARMIHETTCHRHDGHHCGCTFLACAAGYTVLIPGGASSTESATRPL